MKAVKINTNHSKKELTSETDFLLTYYSFKHFIEVSISNRNLLTHDLFNRQVLNLFSSGQDCWIDS